MNNKLIELFDDVVNSEGIWSQICNSCTKKLNVPNKMLSDNPSNSICGVKNCSNECDYYIDFYIKDQLIKGNDSTNDLTIYFENEMNVNGLDHLIFSSFEEAEKSGREYSMVYIPSSETGYFDIYLTAIKGGKFGEYVCWVDDEFMEDNEDKLIDTIVSYIVNSYTYKNVEEKLQELNPMLYFKPYNKG